MDHKITQEEIDAVNPMDGTIWRNYDDLNDREKYIRNNYATRRFLDNRRGWSQLADPYHGSFVDSLTTGGFFPELEDLKPSDFDKDPSKEEKPRTWPQKESINFEDGID